MKEQLVSFDTAKLSKEKGFKNSSRCYDGSGYLLKVIKNHSNNSMQRFRFEAPTQSLLQKWLREIHDIHIEVCHDSGPYALFVFGKGDAKPKYNNYEFNTYEEALEEGLQEALKLIKL